MTGMERGLLGAIFGVLLVLGASSMVCSLYKKSIGIFLVCVHF